MSNYPSRWIVTRFSSMGDVILSLAVARAIKEACGPSAHVTVVTSEAHTPIPRMSPDCDHVISVSPHDSLMEIGRRIRAGHPDVAIDLQGTPKSWWLTSLMGAQRTARVDKRSADRRWRVLKAWVRRTVKTPTTSGPMYERTASSQPHLRHVVDDALATLHAFGIRTARVSPRCLPPPDAVAGVSERIHDRGGLAQPCIGLVPGARWATKRWPVEHYADLAVRLKQSQPCTILLFGNEADRPLCTLIAKEVDTINLVGSMPLTDVAAWMMQCALVFGGDTGLLHLAHAVGTPVEMVYGPTDPFFGFYPYGVKDRWVEMDLPCRPCTLHGGHACPIGSFLCMRDLSIEVKPATR